MGVAFSYEVRGSPSSGRVSQGATERAKPCDCGFIANGESIAARRTLARPESGQPPPNRFEPQTLQNVLAVPSLGWYVSSSFRPRMKRIEAGSTNALAVPTPPEIFLQVVQ